MSDLSIPKYGNLYKILTKYRKNGKIYHSGGAVVGIYSKLKTLMELNDMSDAELSRLSGVPVSSIYSMKMRDSNRTDLDVLKSIASVFGVNISFFVSDDPSDFIKLSEEEARLILKYRLLEERGIKCVNAVIDCLSGNVK